MTINKYQFSILAVLLITGCSSNPYHGFAKPTLEKVLNAHAEKVQHLGKNDPDSAPPQHLEKMYQEWLELKPKIQALLEQNTLTAKQARPPLTAITDKDVHVYLAKSLSDSTPSYGQQGKYTLQIGASSTQAGVEKLWRSQQKKHPKLFQHLSPVVEQTTKSGKALFRLKVGHFNAYKKADKLCQKIRTENGQCLVKKLSN